jgi:metallo-beta-lactamase family protein
MKLKFLGAAGTVTGSKTMCSHGGASLLVDCGLFQGPKAVRLGNWEPFRWAEALDAVILTHAHLDHCGYLPSLVAQGYTNPIYCTPATRDLCQIILLDAAHLQEEDAIYANKTGHSRHKPALPLFTTEDARRALKLFRTVERDRWVETAGGMSFRLSRSGHILGSSFVELSSGNGDGNKTVLFSGDVGNGRSRLIKAPVTGLEADVLVLESTYGDRLQPRADPGAELARVVNRAAGRGGVLVIPAFSVGRTQEILFLLSQLERDGVIPSLPVFVDSPMSNQATEIYMRHQEDHLLVERHGRLEEPMVPSQFRAVIEVSESAALARCDGPLIVISAAGMLTGGRILHHLKHRLPDPKNILLFVGYQAAETKGRLLQEGLKEVRIHHEDVPVRAEIVTLEGFSAHADQKDLLDWVRTLRGPLSRVFINHGEGAAPGVLAQCLRQQLNLDVAIPAMGEEFVLW